jgi:hypothetical protein
MTLSRAHDKVMDGRAKRDYDEGGGIGHAPMLLA